MARTIKRAESKGPYTRFLIQDEGVVVEEAVVHRQHGWGLELSSPTMRELVGAELSLVTIPGEKR